MTISKETLPTDQESFNILKVLEFNIGASELSSMHAKEFLGIFVDIIKKSGCLLIRFLL